MCEESRRRRAKTKIEDEDRSNEKCTVGCPTCGVLGLPNIERNQNHLRKALVFPDIGVTNVSAGCTTYGTFLVIVLEQFAIAYTVGADLRVCPGGWL